MHFLKTVRQYHETPKFTNKIKWDEYERHLCMEFAGEWGCCKGELTKRRRIGWAYETPSCDPGQQAIWTSKQLRQIADKLDELNRI